MSVNEWKKSFIIMWCAQFIGMSAITGLISFLPLYVSHLGIVEESSVALWSGLLIGASSFAAAIANPYWGALADRKGRKPMTEKVLFMFGLIMIGMSFAANVYQLFALRIFQGLCGGFVAASTALVTSLTPKEKIPFMVGMFQTAMIAGGAVGPMIGGFIADSFGYRQPFIVFGLLCFITLAVIHFAIQEVFQPAPQKEKTSIRKTFADLWSLADLKLMLVIQFLSQFAIQSIGPILPLYIQSLSANTANLASISGTIIAIGGVSSAIASASMGQLCHRFSYRQILITAALLGAISFIGQLAAADIVMLGFMRAINGLCIGAMIPSSNTIITFLIPESKRGAAFGATSSASLMGNVLGPLCAGLSAMVFGLHAIFWITAALFIVIMLLIFFKIQANYEPEATTV